MAEIFVPTLHTFENNNIFTGSCGSLRFRIEPKVVKATPKEVDLAALDFTRPVYLEQTGRHYILSKLKTDASTDICTAILVQLPE